MFDQQVDDLVDRCWVHFGFVPLQIHDEVNLADCLQSFSNPVSAAGTIWGRHDRTATKSLDFRL
jgi:hypothetical protein